MDFSDEQYSIAQRFQEVAGEIEARDVTFRNELRSLDKDLPPPWIMKGRSELKEEEMKVWRRLDRGEISEEEAVNEFTALMEEYYGLQYPLDK